MASLKLTKHHGLGNDFLVLLDLEANSPFGPDMARALCDRHRGVGADGLIRVTAGRDGADVTMELRNADGGLAEISGNGLRCLGQAVTDAGVVPGPELAVSTMAGLRRLLVRPGASSRQATVEVEMGLAKVGPDLPAEPPARRACAVDMGNPHLVLLVDDPAGVDVAGLGPSVESRHPGGINVELMAVGPGADQVSLRVWERGVGETLACGTGACAAAAAAHEWGLVGGTVVVSQPGGAARVELSPEAVVLTGPVERIARIEVEL